MIKYDLEYINKNIDFDLKIEYGLLMGGFEIHTHSFHELVIVFGGHAIHTINDVNHFVKRGDVFVLKPNTVHYFSNNENLFICNIMYSNVNAVTSNDDYKALPGFHTLFVISPYLNNERKFSSYLHLSNESTEYIQSLVKKLRKEYSEGFVGYKTMCYSILSEIIVFLSREYTNVASRPSHPELVNIGRAIAYIEENYTQDIKIEQIAKTAGLSVRHFSRMFNQLYLDTPLNYILGLRIKHACKLLKDTDLTASQIAFASGFNDSNYFTRYFKKIIGTTPLKYRY